MCMYIEFEVNNKKMFNENVSLDFFLVLESRGKQALNIQKFAYRH